MKNKAWFFYLILILIVINFSVLLFLKYSNVNTKIKNKISKELGKALNAKVSIEDLSLNDRQINITKLKIKSDDIYLCSKQIYIEYNLFSLLKSRFKNFRGISFIKIYNPKIKLKIKPKKREKKKDKKIQIPDLRNFFKRLELNEGSLEIEYITPSLKISQKLKDINLNIKNGRKNDINLSATGYKSDSLFCNVVLQKGKFKRFDIELKNFSLDEFFIKNFPKLEFALNLSAKSNKENTKISGNLKDVNISYQEWNLKADSLKITGDKNEFSLLFDKKSYLDGFPLKGILGIENYLETPKFKANLSIQKVNVEKYSYYVYGLADAQVNIRGKLASPIVNIKANSPKLTVEGETLKNAKVSAKYQAGRFSFKIDKVFWQNNPINGYGSVTSKKGVVCKVYKKNLKFKKYGMDFVGDLNADLVYKKGLRLNVNLDNLTAKKNSITLQNTFVHGLIKGNKWEISLKRDKNIKLKMFGNFKKRDLTADLILKRLKLSELFNNPVFPVTSGKMNFVIQNGKIISKADVIFYDQNFGKFDGEITYDFISNKNNNTSYLNFKTKHARYNFEPFDIKLLAKGTADSLHTESFRINDKISIDAFVKTKPKFDMGFRALGSNITTEDILKYVTDYETIENYKGYIDFALNYNSWEDKNIEGIITAKSLAFGNISDINAYITFFGNKTFFTLDKLNFYHNSHKFFAARGNILFKPHIRAKFIGKLQDLDLRKFFKQKSMKGKLNGDFIYNIKNGSTVFNAEINSAKAKILGIKTDTLSIKISQEDKHLNILNCTVKSKKDINFSANGNLGYNIFSQNFYPAKDTLNISFSGDILKVLKNKIKSFEQGKSKTTLKLKLTTKENGLNIVGGQLLIKKGLLKIKKQPVPIDKINVNILVKDDKLKVNKFKARLGDGYLTIKNRITNSKNDFVFANINLGKFLIKTDKNGILLYIPGYVPENSFLNVLIRGREGDYLNVEGPFDDMKIKGDIEASNGNLVYPPHTENLLKLIKNPINTKHKESETIYPFSLDIMLNVGENIHYTTYPINLLMKKGGYLNLLYQDGVFSIPDAFFVSERGNLDIFGTDMIADYVSVRINKLVNGFKLNAEFYKDIPDGTRVTMLVYTKDEKGKNKIQFRFLSDRPGDSTMDIISMLRYGKRMEDINPSERNGILQDELVQIAGIGIENAFITPLFYPFENFVKHLLRLDYFNIKTGIVQNVFNRYYRSNADTELSTEENKITKFGADMFLNNLTLQFTKHIYKKTFFDYTLNFQKSTNLAIQSKLGIYQKLALKIEIPYKYRLSLEYNILPFNEKNSVQIGIEKSFKFY